MVCELRDTCPLFQGALDAGPAERAMFRARYCNGDYAVCARYLVFTALGRDAVPDDLYPNDRLRALSIVRPHRPAATRDSVTEH